MLNCVRFFATPTDYSPRDFSVHGASPGKNTRVGCHALLQEIFPIQGSNPGILHYEWILYQLSHQGNPYFAYQFSSVTQLCPTLCNPKNHSRPGLPVHHQLPESIKPMSVESVMPSNHLILCRPLLLLPSIFPSIRVFSNESALRIMWPKYWSFSFNISPSNEHPGLISFRMDCWICLQSFFIRFNEIGENIPERLKMDLRGPYERKLTFVEGLLVPGTVLGNDLPIQRLSN